MTPTDCADELMELLARYANDPTVPTELLRQLTDLAMDWVARSTPLDKLLYGLRHA